MTCGIGEGGSAEVKSEEGGLWEAGRVRPGCRSGRAAPPDRASSEVGFGRSCAVAGRGYTPLQVPLWGTCKGTRGRSFHWCDPSRCGGSTSSSKRADRACRCV